MCDPAHPAGCNYQKPCEASCGHFTPEDMLGHWRGFEVKEGTPGKFAMGEFDAVFTENKLTVMGADGSKEEFDVSTT